MAINTFTNLSEEAKQFYDRNMLLRAKNELVYYMSGQQRNVSKRGGNQISYRRLEALSTVTTPLVESITPAGASLDITEVTVNVQQYGNFVTISDQVDMMGIDPILTEATDVLGQNGGESVDQIVRNEIVTGTSVIYGTGSARNAQSGSNPMTLALLRKAVRTLQMNKSKPFTGDRDGQGMGGYYRLLIGYSQWFDLLSDTNVQNNLVYNDTDKFYSFKIPELAQCQVFVTNDPPIFVGAGSGAADVHAAILLGKEAFGVANVGGTGKFETIVKAIGSGGTEDPMNQRGTVAWKAYQAPKLLNNNYLVRIETGVTA